MNYGLLTPEEIFYYTYLDLIHKYSNWSKYNLLMLSGLLRKLLIDKQNLAHQANKNYKLQILFEVEDYSNYYTELEENKVKVKVEDKYFLTYRRVGPSQNPVKVNLDKFLKIPFYFIDGEVLVIQDLIKTYSNKAGGVHLEETNKKIEMLITNPNFYLFDAPFTDVIISDVTDITIKALNPLARVISTSIKRN